MRGTRSYRSGRNSLTDESGELQTERGLRGDCNWLVRLERETGIEPATFSLGS